MVSLGAPGVAAIMKDRAAGRADPQRVAEIRDGDVVFAFVVIGGATHIVERDLSRLQPQRLGGVRDQMAVVALLVPADRAPEIDCRQFFPENTLSAMILLQASIC